MVEFLTTLTVMSLIIPLFLISTYLAVAKISIKFILRQAGVCMSYERSITPCKAYSRKLSQRLLPIGRIQTLSLSRNSQYAQSQIKYSLAKNFIITDSYQVNLPLKADSL